MQTRKLLVTVGVASLLLFAGCTGLLGGQDAAAPSGTSTDASADQPATAVATEMTAATATRSSTVTPTPTAKPTQTATATESSTATPTATATETATPTAEDDVVLKGGDLPVDEDQVFAQVQELLGADVEPPTVYVREEMPGLERYNRILASNPYYETFGYGSEFINTSVYHGSATPDRIVVMPNNASEAELETVLAHEYVHWLQFHSDVADTSDFGKFVDDTDSSQVRLGLVEGASVYITDQYMVEYMNVSWNQTQELRGQYDAGPPGRRQFRARYLYGSQYIHSTIDRPGNLSWLYDSDSPTPVTSEQMLHGDTPGEEPERSLDVSVNGTGNWTAPDSGADTKGEIVVRTMLRVELNESAAATAATGWGTDESLQFTHSNNESRVGFAWTLHWDNATHADEFQSAYDEWMAERSGADSTAFRQVRLDDQTVVVFAGDPAFVENASASGSNSNVTISASGSSTGATA